MTAADAVIYGASELVIGPAAGTTDGSHPGADGSPADPDDVLERIEDGAVAIANGEVVAVGPTDDIVATYPPEDAAEAIDASGKTVLPGFVDSHTHAVFAGDRSDEFAAKLRGKPYQDILEEGGGILRTVRACRDASDAELLELLLKRLDTMLSFGATTVEVKSGYGLDTETERRLLEVVGRAAEAHPVRVIPTFMGAHAVPEDESTADYVDQVIEDQLPAVAEHAVFCDIFCEEDVFSVEDSRRVLTAGREHGLEPKIHAEEFAHLGGSQLAAELNAVSADHLLQATDSDAAAIADSDVTPALLPGTAFALGTEYAEPRQFLAAGSEVAVATDFNPNCYAPGMEFALTLACVGMGLSPAEAVRAGTYGGGLALGAPRSEIDRVPTGCGTLREGAPGDLLVLDAPSHAHVPYRFDESVVERALIGGEPAYRSRAGTEVDR
ncbi:imidazolonepropionase [Natrialba chahannaoensis JCM 10990]|uniref:Imidazolonepropionase n=1 Tax=Natrialba chahannaoensis JCM 10990 TaxID=1227492 RepID=M0B3A5_9EURY|nr:imidazolonepropionase [Natrialba chahannaoensis]ELZ04723.1 imidazolonepropionase [Natrialba chahannaoensis JCM 10990]